MEDDPISTFHTLSSLSPPPQTLAQLVLDLKQHVTVEETANQLRVAAQTGDENRIRACIKALEALRDNEPLWMDDRLANILLQGLDHPDAKIRLATIQRLTTELRHISNPALMLAITRIEDRDTAVGVAAGKLCVESALLSNDKRAIVMSVLTSKSNPTTMLRKWETAVAISAATSTSTTEFPPDCALVLEPMFQLIQHQHDDVLVMMNVLQVMKELVQSKHGQELIMAQPQRELIKALFTMVTSPFLGDDVLRVLALVLLVVPQSNETRTFLHAIQNRLRDPGLGAGEMLLGPIEALAMFMGACEDNLQVVMGQGDDGSLIKLWLTRVLECAKPGAVVDGRIASLDAIAKALRGGMRRDDVVVVGNNNNKHFSQIVKELFSNHQPELMKCIISAVFSLEPKLQVAGYAVLRAIVSQMDEWGIRLVFRDETLTKALLNENMPTPNASKEAMEWRFMVVKEAIRNADDEMLGPVLAEGIRAAGRRGVFGGSGGNGGSGSTGTARLLQPQADVAVEFR